MGKAAKTGAKKPEARPDNGRRRIVVVRNNKPRKAWREKDGTITVD